MSETAVPDLVEAGWDWRADLADGLALLGYVQIAPNQAVSQRPSAMNPWVPQSGHKIDGVTVGPVSVPVTLAPEG